MRMDEWLSYLGSAITILEMEIELQKIKNDGLIFCAPLIIIQ